MSLENKRRFGHLSVSTALKDKNIVEKYKYFISIFDLPYIKINFLVYNQNMQCVKLYKQVDLIELLKYLTWSGFRSSVDQILLKIKYCIESDKDTIHNISLAEDFNLNILVHKESLKTKASGE